MPRCAALCGPPPLSPPLPRSRCALSLLHRGTRPVATCRLVDVPCHAVPCRASSNLAAPQAAPGCQCLFQGARASPPCCPLPIFPRRSFTAPLLRALLREPLRCGVFPSSRMRLPAPLNSLHLRLCCPSQASHAGRLSVCAPFSNLSRVRAAQWGPPGDGLGWPGPATSCFPSLVPTLE